MDSRFASFSFLFHLLLLLLLLQCIHTNSKKVYDLQQAAMDNHLRAFTKQGDNHDHPSFAMDASLNVFFTINDLKVGKRKPIYFAMKNPSLSPRLLPREEADSIPFSLSHLQELLDFFSFSDESPQAKAMEYTLGECEMEPMRGERKFCATSLESMLDSARGVFGLDAEIKVLTTRLGHRSSGGVGLQNYTVLKAPEEISTPRMVACHPMPYPYAVFYCHGQESDHRLFRVSLGGDGGERVEALGVCHMDTSQWDPNHAAFRVLKTRPGRSPVCHFFPADNLVWADSPTGTQLVG